MGFLRPNDVAELEKIFAGLTQDVRVVLTTDDLDLRLLVDEIAGAAKGRIALEKVTGEGPRIELSSPLAKGKLWFEGLPVGYGTATFVGVLNALGGGLGDQPVVSPAAQAKLDALTKDLRFEVFSTPG